MILIAALLPAFVAFARALDSAERVARFPSLTSWWRSAAANVAAGGAQGSLHLLGLAVDVEMLSDADLAFVAACERLGLFVQRHPDRGYAHVGLGPGDAVRVPLILRTLGLAA